MNEIIYFDICALVLIVGILVVFYLRKNTPCRKNFIYKKLIWTILVSTLVHMLILLISDTELGESIPLIFTVKIIYALIQTTLPVLMCFYIIRYIDEFREIGRVTTAFLVLPVIILDILILLTPLTKMIFYYLPGGGLVQGNGYFIMYEVGIAYTVISVMYILLNMKRYDRFNRYALEISLFYSLTPLLMRLLMPGFKIENFGYTVSALILFMTIESVESIVDTNTGMFNAESLSDTLKTFYISNTEFDAVILKNAELELIIERTGHDLMKNLFREVAAFISETAVGAKTYFVDNECFVLIYPTENAHVEQNILKIQERMGRSWNVGDLEIIITQYVCRINVPRDAANLDRFMDYLRYIQNIKKMQDKRIFVDDINLEDRKRMLAVELAIKEAFEKDMFQVWYQPIYSVEDDKIISAEALLRLETPELGKISPVEFIPAAERNGKIVKLGALVFDKVCRFIAENDLMSLGIKYIEVNLSVVQCMQADLAEEFMAILDKYHINPAMICLEITETAAENVSDMLVQNVDKLEKNGVKFALDDFGTGYSNLQKMISLPFSYVKYDKEMIWAAVEGGRARIAVESNSELMKNLGMKVVAEGVETAEQLEEMKKIGVDYIQGYYFSKAVPDNEFLEYVRGH